MVHQVTTYYCDICQAPYPSFDAANQCEHDGGPALLASGSAVLWADDSADGFNQETGHLNWSAVTSVRTQPGALNESVHRHFYRVEGRKDEIAQQELALIQPGGLSWQQGLVSGPEPARSLTVLMETHDEIRDQLGECFGLLSQLAGIEQLTAAEYAKWDDLRYTVYDFGFIDGDNPAVLPAEMRQLLAWCAEPVPVAELHLKLFTKPGFGLHGGPLVHAPFDDNVGLRTKWLIGRGDPYRYLRFHMQPHSLQLQELQQLQDRVFSDEEVWLDDVALLFRAKTHPTPQTPAVAEWQSREEIEAEPTALAGILFEWICNHQERWRKSVDVAATIIPAEVPVIAVAAGKGGVGKSTIAAEFARSLAHQGRRPLLLDLDFYGPSAPVEFGLEGQYVSISGGFIQPQDADGVKIVSIGNMIAPDAALHWRGPVLEAFIHLLTAHISYDDVDLIVLDCPPGTGDVQLGIMNRIRPDVTILVTTASNLALADVRRAATSFREAGVKVTGVIENMSWIDLGNGVKKRLFGNADRVTSFCAETELQCLGEIPFVDNREELGQTMNKIAAGVVASELERSEL